jgi:hypothetical protein
LISATSRCTASLRLTSTVPLQLKKVTRAIASNRERPGKSDTFFSFVERQISQRLNR